MNEKFFTTVLMALDFLASVPYAVKGDVKMAVVQKLGRTV